ncbi:uncharacterized protein At4g06744-like [Nicotiana sylvestris]|uniref:Uncharacterized protein At4g06744-like n=1 Tax=Nicotiana sylvestris TaxID=4096 RepID=A0A1U7WVW5_NICSY|nr:PREDICTED: uncharacterized protein At4g06744-like [Nicotiana sylvestris]XP_016471503.1 PREDICTED: uncharacterized protein At4g06744-like [Nicotiana tabacum]
MNLYAIKENDHQQFLLITFFMNFSIFSSSMMILYFFIFFSVLRNCTSQLLPPLPAPNLTFLDQRLALIFPIIQNFKNTITLDPLGVTQSWTGPNICNYKGFYCDNPPYNTSAISLASIDFNGFQLTAPTLDGFIDQLPDLAIFHANSNNFSGIISSKITQLPYLYELDLSNNKFIGTFPLSVLNIKTLTFLDIRYNLFTGIIPPQIFTQNLDAFFLNNNNFIQKLPDNLGSTTALYLTLANNKFIGPIPRSIGQAPNLLEILFLNNLLTGCIPYELGLLKKAIVIDVGYNMLTGPLPCSFGCLESVEQLNFAGNLLYGQVPEVVCSLTNLVNFTLSYNYFTKVGPLCRELIKKGILNVEKNCILGLPNQRSIVECLIFRGQIKLCPLQKTYNVIPCKIPKFRPNRPPRAERHLISYSALSKITKLY